MSNPEVQSPQQPLLPKPDMTDVSSMNWDALIHYFYWQGNSHEMATQLASNEVWRRIHERIAATAQAIGLTQEAYSDMFEQYGYQQSEEILKLLREKKASTPEEAQKLLTEQADGKSIIVLDSVRKVMDKRFHNPQDKTEKMLNKIDRHGVRKHHRWGKKDVIKLYERREWEKSWREEMDHIHEQTVEEHKHASKQESHGV